MTDADNRVKITKTAIDALAPRAKPYLVWDADLPGFGVRVQPSGVKSFVVQFRTGGGGRSADEYRYTLGKTTTLTAVQARKAAADLLARVRLGGDPVGEQKAALAVPTFAELADEWLAAHVRAKRKTRTAREYERLLKTVINPEIGETRFTDLRRADVARLHESMAETMALANRALAIISSVWNWAARREIVEMADNPAKGIERYKEHGRERFLSSSEFARLGDALHDAETVGIPYNVDETKPGAKHFAKPENRRVKLDPFAVAAIRLLVLTGARLREILDAQWSQVDLERGVIFLADSKTGRKPVYLSAAARSVLTELPRIEGNPHIIAGAREGAPRADLKKPWAAVKRAAGLEGVRLHDLRHSFASLGAGGGLGLPIVGRLLGHSQPAATTRYAHLDADPLRRAVDTIGERIEGMMRKQNADVVPIRRAKAGD